MFKDAIRIALKYIQHEDVNDIYFGRKYRNGKVQMETAIRFNVQNKIPRSRLKAHRLLPKKIGRFITDVTVFKPTRNTRIEDPMDTVRPVLGGLQIQSSLFNGPLEWGTLGCTLRMSGLEYGITNYHVAFGDADSGGDTTNPVNILQPKYRNGGTPIGTSTNCNNATLDYSLFRLSAPFDGGQSINASNGELEGYTNPVDGMKLFKYGAASGKTFGIYDARSIIDQNRIIIRYDPAGPNDSARISMPGDSGAVWATTQNASTGNLRMLALHYGGDETHNIAFASLFSSIMPSIKNQIPLL